MDRVKLAALLVLGLLGVIIILQNTAPVETRILFVTITMPRAALLFAVAAIGFLMGVTASVLFIRKKKKKE